MRRRTGGGKYSARAIATLEKENQVLAYIRDNPKLSLRDIGALMGCHHTMVLKHFKRAMRRREDSFMETLEIVRRTELMRLDHMFATHFQRQAFDINSASMCLQIMERRTRYIGLDSPFEARVVPDRPSEPRAFDLSRLSREDLQTLRDIMARMAKPPKVTQQPAIEFKPGEINIVREPS